MTNLKNILLIDGSIESEIRTAVVNSEKILVDYNFFRGDDSILNNIYIGQIEDIRPAIEAVFVRYDRNSFGFLSFNDIHESYFLKTPRRKRQNGQFQEGSKIQEVLKKGQLLIVQVSRCGMEKKLPTLTTFVNLLGKNCIYLPNDENNNGISRKIGGFERAQLKEFLEKLDNPGSLIIRTASEGGSLKEIQEDYKNLVRLWRNFQRKLALKSRPGLIFQEDLLLKALRGYSKYDLDAAFVSNKNVFRKVADYVASKAVHLPNRLEFYPYDDLFHAIEDQVENLYRKKLDLASGGSIMIESTEALVAIDINSKKSAKENNMELTAFRTNQEAIDVIVKQIILRNLGGLIVIDCIDMDDDSHVEQINKQVKEGFRNDKAAVKIIGYSPLGLIQISRQRLDTSLIDREFQDCSHCGGLGRVLKPEIKVVHFVRKIMISCHLETAYKIYVSAQNLEQILTNFGQFLMKYPNISWKIVPENAPECDCIEKIESY